MGERAGEVVNADGEHRARYEHVKEVAFVDYFRLAYCAFDGQDWPCPWSKP